MSIEAEEFLADLLSSYEYLNDRGEVPDHLEGILTSIRYTRTTAIPQFEVIWKGRTITVTAADSAVQHQHVFPADDSESCDCGAFQ